ncbi:TetR/AcrR family transcriptional regulator [Paraburkholderia sp. J67]|uniref:TetR/AcrR family transcriptional regulator n=1 Tax=Paraburkholderia sp. J67 TaxID=2805435 RepID=UPI002ABE4E9C|nr:TetR/AcrR family transcriptional regulator [Paraburkholderia sp. J67]
MSAPSPSIPPARGRGRPASVSPEARREQILNVAEQLFRHSGYAATSMADIARQCEMSKRTLYEAFETKESLFRALVVDVQSFPAHECSVDPARTPAAIVAAALNEIAHYVLSERHIMVSRIVIAESELSPAIREHYYEQGIDRSKRFLVAQLGALVEAGRIVAVNADRIADMLFGAVIATHLIAAISYRQTPDFDEVSAKIEEVVTRFIVAV